MVLVNPLTELDLVTLRRRRSMKWRRYPEDVLPLWVAEMDTPLAPPVVDALSQAVWLGDTGYADVGRLAEVFAGFAYERFGWWPDPAQCTLVGDVAQGIVEVLGVVTEPGDVVLIGGPTYSPFRRIIPRAGRVLRENPMTRGVDGRFRLDLDRLASDLAAPEVTAYLLVNPHNPTG